MNSRKEVATYICTRCGWAGTSPAVPPAPYQAPRCPRCPYTVLEVKALPSVLIGQNGVFQFSTKDFRSWRARVIRPRWVLRLRYAAGRALHRLGCRVDPEHRVCPFTVAPPGRSS